MRWLVFLVIFAFPVFAHAELEPRLNAEISIEINNAYTLVAPKWLKSRPVYMEIVNPTDTDDVLIKASSPIAKKVLLQYTHNYGEGINTMRPLPKQEIRIPAKSIVKLKPGGIHLMLSRLNQPLKLGMEIPVKLTFKNSPALYVKAVIHQQPNQPVPIIKEH